MHNNNNGYPSNLAAWTTVAILMVAYVLSFIDRQIITSAAFTALLLMAIASTMLTVPMVAPRLQRRLAGASGPARRD